MTRSEPDIVLDQVVHAVADVLAVPKGEIGIETRASDLEAWDSFGHVRIVLAVEALFGIQLTIAEIEASASIAGLVQSVEAASERREALDQ